MLWQTDFILRRCTLHKQAVHRSESAEAHVCTVRSLTFYLQSRVALQGLFAYHRTVTRRSVCSGTENATRRALSWPSNRSA